MNGLMYVIDQLGSNLSNLHAQLEQASTQANQRAARIAELEALLCPKCKAKSQA